MDESVVKMVLPQEARVFLVERVFSCADENTDVYENAPRISVADAPKPVRRQVIT